MKKKRVYIASFFADKDRVKSRAKELTEAGVVVTSRWFNEDAPHNATLKDCPDEYLRETAVIDIDDILAANTVVLTVPTPEQMVNLTPGQLARGGRVFESGFQYGLMIAQWLSSEFRTTNRELILLGPRENVFHFLDGTSISKRYPAIRRFDTWEEVVSYLKGE
jgi:hypothetical protein